MKCPVCNTKCNDNTQICQICAWEFSIWVSEISDEQRNLYNQKLKIAQNNWQKLKQMEKKLQDLEQNSTITKPQPKKQKTVKPEAKLQPLEKNTVTRSYPSKQQKNFKPEIRKTAVTEENPEAIEHLLSVDPMELEIGYSIIPLVDKTQDGELLDRIRSIRRQFAIEMGMVLPPIHIRDNLKLKPNEYRIMINNSEVGWFELMMNHQLAIDPGDISINLEGLETKEPAFDLPAIWIPLNQREEAKFAGYTVVDNPSVMATHITSIIRMHADELLGRQEVQHLLDTLKKSYPQVIKDIDPQFLPLKIIQKVLQNLVKECVSIRNLLAIVETLINYADTTQDPELLTEYVRQKLARSIVSPYLSDDGTLNVITIAQDVEEVLMSSIQKTEFGSYLSVAPKLANTIMESIGMETEKLMAMGFQPIILCSPTLRRHLRKMVEQFTPSLIVFSEAELLRNIGFKSLGKVRLKYEQ